jgi:hypothetical protein
MLLFDELKDLRDRLVNSLMRWGLNCEDGFYRSSPTSRLTPSFTNTGMVLLAFLESRNFHLAHNLADSLLTSLHTKYRGIFPHEKADNAANEGHTLCNAWASFAILDTYPNRVAEVSTICKWFLDNQRKDGSWPLFPGETTHELIVTAYVVSALQQFHRCFLQLQALGKGIAYDIDKIEQAIELAVSYLQDSRPQALNQQGMYLWPASLGPGNRRPLSLGTSTLCMHVLSKWGRYHGRPELVDGVAGTFVNLLAGFDEHSELYCNVGGQRLAIWDQLNFNEGKIHYHWSFFAPITIITMLTLSERKELLASPSLVHFVRSFAEWILEHAIEMSDGTIGVCGGETIPDVKVWSTAQSVIVLSRLLERRHLFRQEFGPESAGSSPSRERPTPRVKGKRSRKIDVFLSHAMIDRDQAREIYALLGARGFSVFLAEKSIKPGSRWENDIRSALEDCLEFWMLVTPDSLESKWVQSEWAAAWGLKKEIVPILLRCNGSLLPEPLRGYQAVDFDQVGRLVDELATRSR